MMPLVWIFTYTLVGLLFVRVLQVTRPAGSPSVNNVEWLIAASMWPLGLGILIGWVADVAWPHVRDGTREYVAYQLILLALRALPARHWLLVPLARAISEHAEAQ